MDSFHIWYKWSLAWEGVSHVMTFDLDLFLRGHSAFGGGYPRRWHRLIYLVVFWFKFHCIFPMAQLTTIHWLRRLAIAPTNNGCICESISQNELICYNPADDKLGFTDICCLYDVLSDIFVQELCTSMALCRVKLWSDIRSTLKLSCLKICIRQMNF